MIDGYGPRVKDGRQNQSVHSTVFFFPSFLLIFPFQVDPVGILRFASFLGIVCIPVSLNVVFILKSDAVHHVCAIRLIEQLPTLLPFTFSLSLSLQNALGFQVGGAIKCTLNAIFD